MRYLFWPTITVQLAGFLWGMISNGVHSYTIMQLWILAAATFAFVISYKASNSQKNTHYRKLIRKSTSKEAIIELTAGIIGYVLLLMAASFYIIDFIAKLATHAT